MVLAILLFPQQIAAAPDGYGVEVEIVNEDILGGYYTTYRLYVVTNNEDDFVSSISGDTTNPTYVRTTTDFWHSAIGGKATGSRVETGGIQFFPDLAYDSWVTIGLDGLPDSAAGEAGTLSVYSYNPWLSNFDPGTGAPGGEIAIDDAYGGLGLL